VGARTGAEFLAGLQKTPRQLFMNGECIEDVTADPRLAGGAQMLAAVFDRQHAFPDDCLIPDPVTGESINVSHMLPRSVDDLRHRNRGLSRLSEMSAGMMGRTPDYMNIKFAAFAARARDWSRAAGSNEQGAEHLIEYQKKLARDDIALTHTIIQPTINKATDPVIVGNKVTIHKVADTADGIVVRGARILGTLAPYADDLAVYPALPIPEGADDYAVAFSIPVDTPGLTFLCRDSATVPSHPFDRPLSSRFDEQDAFVMFDDVEIPADRLFIDGTPGSVDAYNSFVGPHYVANMTTQATIRALNKLEFSYGLATMMAETIGDASPATSEMLGELLSYVEVTRSAVLVAADHGWADDNGVWFCELRALTPMRSLLALWFPRVNEIITLIGSHNLLATPTRADLDNEHMRSLVDEFLHGANGIDAEQRAAVFRLAWDYVGSALGGRNVLYERFYLASAARNRVMAHQSNRDRSRAYELVEMILSAGRSTSGGAS
jgi:aromatic ring hydroxylase